MLVAVTVSIAPAAGASTRTSPSPPSDTPPTAAPTGTSTSNNGGAPCAGKEAAPATPRWPPDARGRHPRQNETPGQA